MGGVFAFDLYLEIGSACSGSRTVFPAWELCEFGLIAGATGSMVSTNRELFSSGVGVPMRRFFSSSILSLGRVCRRHYIRLVTRRFLPIIRGALVTGKILRESGGEGTC